MLAKPTPIKLLNAALEDAPNGKDMLFRGRVAIESLPYLLKDDYQREAQPLGSQDSIMRALRTGARLPDLELGMRGERFMERDGAVYLKDPVYIIDGVQRVSTALYFVGANPGAEVRIGAAVHLNTTREFERLRFHDLNSGSRLKVAPSLLLRNMREENAAILSLYGLTRNDKFFPLYGRVCWEQRMKRGEIISALTLAKVAGALHSHKTPGLMRSSIDVLAVGLQKCMATVGVQTFRENLRAFFDLIDQAWGIRGIQYREGAVYMRANFLTILASLLSRHHDFWTGPDEKRLFINVDLARKIAQFPIGDPEVMRLAGAGGKARNILYMLIRDHINSGKRTKRLKPRDAEPSSAAEESAQGDLVAAWSATVHSETGGTHGRIGQ